MNKEKSKYFDYYRSSESAKWYNEKMGDKLEKAVTAYEVDLIGTIIKSRLSHQRRISLDIASGTGRIIREVSKFADLSVGLDASKEMLMIARNNGVSSSLIVSNGMRLPFKNASFDIITIFRLFIHINNDERFELLRECRRILKDNGILIFDTHYNSSSLKGVFHKITEIVTKRERPRISSKETMNFISESGLSIIVFKPIYTSMMKPFVGILSFYRLMNLARRLGYILPARFGDLVVFIVEKNQLNEEEKSV